MPKISEIEREYLLKRSWDIQENANTNYSVSHFVGYAFAKLTVEEVLEQLPETARRLHVEGWFHINKLNDGAWWKPYCCGVDTARVLQKGLITPAVISKPPKHLDSAVDQLANFIMMMSQERTGAVGLHAIDLYLAPFVAKDKLDYKTIKQNIQRFIYNLNYTVKLGYQSPFSNIIIAIGVESMYEAPAYVEGRVVGKLGDYIDEAKLILKALCEVLLEGDAYGRPFTFPIPTVIVTRRFLKILEEDPELDQLFWKVVAERGSFYFLNSLITDRTGIFSFCCRLTANTRKVMEYLHMSRGIWALPPSAGSINYVTINLPRLALEGLKRGDAEKFVFDYLPDLILEAARVLNILRSRYRFLHLRGFYPLTREYIDPYNPFKYYYNTIAVTGLAEYVAIILNDPKLWYREITPSGIERAREIIIVYRKTFEFINKLLDELEFEDGVLYNLEQAPSESSSYRLALLDYERYPEFRDFIPRAKDPFTGTEEVFYTSQITPPYTTYRLSTQITIEGKIQKLFTGGVMKHIFVHRPVEPENVKKLMLDILESVDVVYISYTPTQTICLNCGYRATELFWTCPKCGSNKVEQWSRIVGYYRPVRNWNAGRRAEFASRTDMISLL